MEEMLVKMLNGALAALLLVTCAACVGSGGGAEPEPEPGLAAQFLPSRAQFDALFPDRLDFYSYEGFVQAVASYPGFAGRGSDAVRRREMAAFLANIAHESDFLRALREYNQANHNNYCRQGPGESCAPGQQYYGRGPIQLSWNYQYLAAGQALGLGRELWADPDRVARDATIAWQTAIWYWMTNKGPGSMPAHRAIVDGAGFGEAVRAINGAIECDKGPDAPTARNLNRRIKLFRDYSALFKVEPGQGLGC